MCVRIVTTCSLRDPRHGRHWTIVGRVHRVELPNVVSKKFPREVTAKEKERR